MVLLGLCNNFYRGRHNYTHPYTYLKCFHIALSLSLELKTLGSHRGKRNEHQFIVSPGVVIIYLWFSAWYSGVSQRNGLIIADMYRICQLTRRDSIHYNMGKIILIYVWVRLRYPSVKEVGRIFDSQQHLDFSVTIPSLLNALKEPIVRDSSRINSFNTLSKLDIFTPKPPAGNKFGCDGTVEELRLYFMLKKLFQSGKTDPKSPLLLFYL